jgi:dTDP-4-dehydrorhamnose 3,5-epimerase
MNFHPTILSGVFIIEMQPIADSRGWFARTYCKEEFNAIDHSGEWVQLNHSFTLKKGTIRGMHFQIPPYGEIKLVRCIAGAAFDVVVDLRKDSPTFLKWISVELSAGNKNLIYIPEGFAHGFQALTDNAELIYHHSSYYTPGAEKGIRFDDKMINIKWPLSVADVSDRDRSHELLNDNFKGI